MDWDRLDELFGSTYCPDNGRPGVSTRLMVALHYLKYTYNLSDEDVVAGLGGKSLLAVLERDEVLRA